MNFKILKKIISFVVILTTTHAYADNLPDSLFGVKMFDSIKNYEFTKIYQDKFKDGTRSRDLYLLKYVPNNNEDFDDYIAFTFPDDDKIVSVQGRIKNVGKSSIEQIISNPDIEPICAARDLTKYVTAVSNVWEIREGKFSSEIRYYGKEIPENLEKGFKFNFVRQLNFRKKNIKMTALLRCDYKYYAHGDLVELMSDGKTETNIPFISSDLWIKIMTEEYFKKFPPTKVYKNITVGNFIRQLSEGVSTKGF